MFVERRSLNDMEVLMKSGPVGVVFILLGMAFSFFFPQFSVAAILFVIYLSWRIDTVKDQLDREGQTGFYRLHHDIASPRNRRRWSYLAYSPDLGHLATPEGWIVVSRWPASLILVLSIFFGFCLVSLSAAMLWR